jgi:hypothetical protein
MALLESDGRPAGPVGAPQQPATGPARTLRVIPWRDQVVDTLGVDPRSLYVERFWLPVIGPTCTWLLRHLAAGLERDEAGIWLDLDDTARTLGLAVRQGRHSPFARAMSRCVVFGLARWQGPQTLAVRLMLPPLSRRYVLRLPPRLQEAHDRWTAAQPRLGSLERHRVRARRLALGLVALGESFDSTEAQLLRWGVHPSLTHDAVVWARTCSGKLGPNP